MIVPPKPLWSVYGCTSTAAMRDWLNHLSAGGWTVYAVYYDPGADDGKHHVVVAKKDPTEDPRLQLQPSLQTR